MFLKTAKKHPIYEIYTFIIFLLINKYEINVGMFVLRAGKLCDFRNSLENIRCTLESLPHLFKNQYSAPEQSFSNETIPRTTRIPG